MILSLLGLGSRHSPSRDGYSLYGNELDSTTNPLEVGLGWIVAKNKGGFIGRDAIEQVRKKAFQTTYRF